MKLEIGIWSFDVRPLSFLTFLSILSTMSTVKKNPSLAGPVIGLGFTTLFTQVFLIREAGVWLRGNEFVVAAIVAAWLMWTASGCLAGFSVSTKKPQKLILPAWLFSVIISVAELVFLRCFWTFTGRIQGASVNLGIAAFNAFLLTAPPCLFSGFAVGAAIKSINTSEKKSVAYIYLLETLGALIAGALVTFVFIPLQHWWFSIAFLFSIPIIIYFLQFAICNLKFFIKCIFIFIFLFAAYKSNNSLELFAQKTASKFLVGNIVLDVDAPRERLTVTTQNAESAFYINGRLAGSSDQREQAEEISWYSFLSAGNPESALLIGFPYNGLLREFLQKKIKVTIPDPEKSLLNDFSPFLSWEDSKALDSPNVKIFREDCRTFLQTHKNKFYDCIVQNIGLPESYASSRLYSKEWFEIISRHLSSNGTFSVALPGSAGYVPDDLARILSRTIKTMNSVFKFVTIIPGSSTLLIASNSKNIPDTPKFWLTNLHLTLCSESETSKKHPYWFSPALINDNLNEFRVTQFTNACAQFHAIDPHMDFSPLLYGDALLYSEARFAGNTHKILSALYNHGAAVMIFSFVLFFSWIFAAYVCSIANLPKFNSWLLMTLFSMVGFIGQMTLLVRFVISRGSLFYSIGLLFAGFMFGLAIAAYTIEKFAQTNRKFGAGRSGLSVAIIILCGMLLAITFIPWPAAPALVLIFAFLLNTICGLCVGTCFATLARRARIFKSGGVVLYTADLFGAFLGALLFSIIIPPVLGFGFLTVILSATLLLMVPCSFFR